MNVKPATSVVFGLGPLLTLTAVALSVLKVTGVLKISWLWALSPLWLGTASAVAICGLFLAGAAVVSGVIILGALIWVWVESRFSK